MKYENGEVVLRQLYRTKHEDVECLQNCMTIFSLPLCPGPVSKWGSAKQQGGSWHIAWHPFVSGVLQGSWGKRTGGGDTPCASHQESFGLCPGHLTVKSISVGKGSESQLKGSSKWPEL